MPSNRDRTALTEKYLEGTSGVPGGIRTRDPLLRRQPLYPLSYRDCLATSAV